MRVEHILVAQPPQAFAELEIQDLIATVRAGGEVGGAILEENVRNAKCLVIVREASLLVGVAALKIPKAGYRRDIKTKAAATIGVEEFPFELGYVFVLPSARRQHLGLRLCRAALDPADGKGVFATARTDNVGMNAILSKLGFSRTGRSYGSERGAYQLQLFVRKGIANSLRD